MVPFALRVYDGADLGRKANHGGGENQPASLRSDRFDSVARGCVRAAAIVQ